MREDDSTSLVYVESSDRDTPMSWKTQATSSSAGSVRLAVCERELVNGRELHTTNRSAVARIRTMGGISSRVSPEHEDISLHEVGQNVTCSVAHPLPSQRLAQLGHYLSCQLVSSFLRHDWGREGKGSKWGAGSRSRE